jgi:hypothetical protein
MKIEGKRAEWLRKIEGKMLRGYNCLCSWWTVGNNTDQLASLLMVTWRLIIPELKGKVHKMTITFFASTVHYLPELNHCMLMLIYDTVCSPGFYKPKMEI